MLEPKLSANVMLRFSSQEIARLRAAWESSDAEAWRRLPFATWCRRTLLNLFPAKAEAPKAKPFRERYGPSRGTPKRRKVA